MRQVVAYNRKFQAKKVVTVAYRRWSFTRVSNCQALTGTVLVFRMGVRLCEVVAYEKWTHMEVGLYYIWSALTDSKYDSGTKWPHSSSQIKPSIEPLACPVFWKRNFDSLQKFRRKRDRRTVVSREEEFPTSSQEMSSHCHWMERMVVEVLHDLDNRASSTQAFTTTIFARIVSGSRVSRVACVAKRSKRFRLVDRGTGLPILGFGRARNETRATPSPLFYLRHFSRGLTLVPRSLLLNRTETLATQASETTIIKPLTNPALRTPSCPTYTDSSLRTVCFVPGERNLLHFL